MGRKPSIVAEKTSCDECWLKEWLFKLIRAASGITFPVWSPQLSTGCRWRARVFLVGAFPVLWFEGRRRALFFIFMPSCHTLFPARQQEEQRVCHLTMTCIDDSTIFFSLLFSSYRSLLQTNLSDHDFLVWKVRNTHHGTRKHIYSDFRVENFRLPSMRITSVLRLQKIKYIFHQELKCRNSHNFLQK